MFAGLSQGSLNIVLYFWNKFTKVHSFVQILNICSFKKKNFFNEDWNKINENQSLTAR